MGSLLRMDPPHEARGPPRGVRVEVGWDVVGDLGRIGVWVGSGGLGCRGSVGVTESDLVGSL